ncbi:MAG: hypothetical protein GXY34_05210 [Syntrophomonadaceae bacterium]|nr:hypothetical protein [Syntrophomonadaceae bacterium]
MEKQKIATVDGIDIYLEGINLYSDNSEYGFSFLTPEKGFQIGKRGDIPSEVLRIASGIIFGDQDDSTAQSPAQQGIGVMNRFKTRKKSKNLELLIKDALEAALTGTHIRGSSDVLSFMSGWLSNDYPDISDLIKKNLEKTFKVDCR